MSETRLSRPTLEQTLAALGDPRPFLEGDGTVGAGWEAQVVAYAKLPAPLPLCWDRTKAVTRFKCHRLLVPHFEAALAEAHADAPVWATIGDFGGCYEFRRRRKASSAQQQLAALSAHAWAAAIDLDVADNPMGGPGRVHERLPLIFARHGILWGRTFPGRYKDPMHWEFVDYSLLGGRA